MPIDKETGKRISMKTGQAIGRPCIDYPSNWDAIYRQWQDGAITATTAMNQTKLKRNTFYKLAKSYQA